MVFLLQNTQNRDSAAIQPIKSGRKPTFSLLWQQHERTDAVDNALRPRRRWCRQWMGAVDAPTLSAVCGESHAFFVTVRLESTLWPEHAGTGGVHRTWNLGYTWGPFM